MTEQRPDRDTVKEFNRNLIEEFRANAQVRLEVATDAGVQAYDATARELPPAERAAILPKLTAGAPVFAEFQSKTSRVIPLFELQRG
ncbi:nitroreductase/quinone reductase family protein [Mycobacterium sherrisii]|uniref:nitroreductase/quinone reductase family protein n=1 Tax=Mycobacterium sherrisii TaxID=243061 RepID=UPI000A15C080|nr:nitroreductase/quinone reductase family protein [Mycobacterium sherrisii]MCV7029132.1 nitroreductase family deazaflavin-dependent oxidoreductase [Mycobacterium sherrisii]ORW75491.1 hypothetical protein AWC25_13700 [Mycobacterium sherrisii]